MAKKKALSTARVSKQPKAEETGTERDDIQAESFVDPDAVLASPVAATAQLASLFLIQSEVRRAINAVASVTEAEVAIDVSEPDVAHDDPITGFSAEIQFVIKVIRVGDGEDIEPSVKISATFVSLYRLPDAEGVGPENLKAFARTSGVFSMWPYVREYVHSTSFRLAVPQIVLPTYRN